MLKVLIVVAVAAGYLNAQGSQNLAGVWELRKSNEASSPGKPESMQMRIDVENDTFAITTRALVNGNLEQNLQRAAVGRETKGEMHGAPLTSKAEWDGSTLVVHGLAVILNKELKLTDRFSLSPDGNTLTFRENSKFGAEPEREQSQVFERRAVSTWQPDAPPKPAEQVFKNIQIFKGVPAPRVRSVMMNLTKWLGVECAHCHVMGQFESDDKPAKNTARDMFRMVRALNQQSFPKNNDVTCWTCHRGSAKPQNLPPQ